MESYFKVYNFTVLEMEKDKSFFVTPIDDMKDKNKFQSSLKIDCFIVNNVCNSVNFKQPKQILCQKLNTLISFKM